MAGRARRRSRAGRERPPRLPTSPAPEGGAGLLAQARASLATNNTSWTLDPTTSTPGALAGALLVYDASDGYVLDFGGTYRYGIPTRDSGQTWKFSSGVWTELYPRNPPSPRYDMAAAYDPVEGYVVMYGGYPGPATPTQTWTYHAGVWTNLDLHHNPGARSEMAMSYDPVSQSIVLFGGFNVSAGANNATWAFHAGKWQEVTPVVAPSPRRDFLMTYDASDHAIVLFGGLSGPMGSPLTDTWQYQNRTWTNVTSATRAPPPADAQTQMAYDPSLAAVVLAAGGANGTWTYHAGVWSPLAVSPVPHGRLRAEVTYDSSDAELVLVGGIGCYARAYCNDTWEFGAPLSFSFVHNWTNLTGSIGWAPPAAGGSMTFDSADNDTVYYGAGVTATYSAGVWTSRPSAGDPENGVPNATIAYDPADHYVVLFGGEAENGAAMGDTWTFQYGVWTWLEQAKSGSGCYANPPVDNTTVPCPPPSYDGTMAFDAADGYLIYDGTWKFSDGSWSPLNSSEPGITAMAYDAADGYVVALNSTGGTFKYLAGNWSTIASSAAPSPRTLPSMAYDPALDAVELIGGSGRRTTARSATPTRGSFGPETGRT